VSISYLLGNFIAPNAKADMQQLFNSPYNTSLRTNVTTIGTSTGYAYLSPIKARDQANDPQLIPLNLNRIKACTN
jgi:hypothetical protein